MISAADTWADFAGTVWADPTTRWIVYALLVIIVGVGMWRGFRRVRTFLAELRADLGAARADLGLVKHEVKNNHTTNLREEADERHDQNYRALARIEQKVDDMAVAVGVHTYRLNQIDEDLERTRDRRPE